MDRREFLISTGGGAAAAALTGSAAKAQTMGEASSPVVAPSIALKRHTLSYYMPWADTGRGFGDQARRLALRIHEATDGRITMALTGDRAKAKVVHGPAYSHETAAEGEDRALAYFAGLPGDAGLSLADQMAWITVGGGQMLWDDLAALRGMKPLAVGHTGERGVLLSNAPMASLADMQGKKIAVMGPAADVARGLGLETVAMSDASSADIVDAGNGLLAISADLHRSHTHAIEGGLTSRGTLMALEVALDAWEGLQAGDRVRIQHAAEAELQASLAETRAHERMVRGVMASSFGVSFSPMPVEIEAARNRVAEAVIAHIAAAGPKAQRINQSFMAFKALIGEAIA